ncbi:winged helix-turn-helix domain-containing protein, partial [Acidithiobacillus thiooxidans]|uniref:winged helix-turn-helix domain-containing protein n=2 Tax=Acidithiobacillaceae TaxID=225058 RepID=UPI0023AAB0DA
PFALWTRPAIRALIRDHFGVDLRERLVGKYLKPEVSPISMRYSLPNATPPYA